jgi:hypothetical protein
MVTVIPASTECMAPEAEEAGAEAHKAAYGHYLAIIMVLGPAEVEVVKVARVVMVRQVEQAVVGHSVFTFTIARQGQR